MEFSPKKCENDNTYCCVPGCSSRARRCPTLRFHLFPKSGQMIHFVNHFGVTETIDRRKLWQMKLLIGKKISDTMRVCSRHFKKDDYSCVGYSHKRYLHIHVVPSQNLPSKSFSSTPEKKKILKKVRQERATRRKLLREFNQTNLIHQPSSSSQTYLEETINEITNDNVINNNLNNTSSLTKFTTDDYDAAKGLLLLLDCDSGKQSTKGNVQDFGCQVNTTGLKTICDLILTDKQLNSLTGIHSFQLLNTIIKLAEEQIKDQRIHRLTVKQRIILTFIKMKIDCSYVVLSILFGHITSQTCKTIFHATLPMLANILKSVIHVTSREEINKNIPLSFKEFRNVRFVLDCTEIQIQQPKCLCCRITTYSHYKGNFTVKFMTAVTPAGLISFVSQVYGGRTSDKIIFEQSGLIKYLDMFNDALMIDKGFLIDGICDSYCIKIIRPPYLRNKKQLTAEESILNAKIAKARVHIERTYQRIKLFKILSNKVPWNLVPQIENLFIIACGITNLSAPILSDNKF